MHFALPLFVPLVALTACSAWIPTPPGPRASASQTISPTQSIGQSFTARQDGLSGIDLLLIPSPESTGEVHLDLLNWPDTGEVLAESIIAVDEISPDESTSFGFDVQPRSREKDYFLHLRYDGEGSVEVATTDVGSYLDGTLYINNEPGRGSLQFKPLFSPLPTLAGVAATLMEGTLLSLLGVILFVLPGFALLELIWRSSSPINWLDKLALGAGLSLAIYPILFLLTDLAGIHLGPFNALIPIVAGLGVILWKYRAIRLAAIREQMRIWSRSPNRTPDLAAVGLIILILAVRLLAVQELAAPMWGDSYQHALITRLMVENGGLFDTWEPYVPLQSFTYHFGFHSASAVLEWTSSLDSSTAVLITGQLLNVLAVIALYPLARKTGYGRWVGPLALLVAGLLTPMPMAYVNWGRYTQLAGQVILPVALWFGWTLLQEERLDWRMMVLGWIVFGGLSLTHYRVLLMAGGFFLAYLLIYLWRPGRLKMLGRLALLAIGSFVIFLPWFLHIIQGPLANLVSSQLSTPPLDQSAWHVYNALDIASLGAFLPTSIWLLLLGSAALGLLWRRKTYLLITGWWLILVLGANPNWLGLPGEGVMSNFAMAIAAYIPAAVLIGAAGGDLLEKGLGRADNGPGIADENETKKHAKRLAWVELFLLCILVLIGSWGGRTRLKDVEPEIYALVTQPDLRAMTWIQENTPPDSVFHVNQFFAFSNSVTVGSDAGWWIPLLASRGSDLPPINYGFEKGPRPDYREWTNALPSLILEKGINDPQVLQEFATRGITHIYLGQRQGRVNHDGSQALDPQLLASSPNYDLIYQSDQVWIFRIRQSRS